MTKKQFIYYIRSIIFIAVAFSTTIAYAANEWGYEGKISPENWAKLSCEYVICGTGTSQSPFNITHPMTADLPNLKFDYKAGEAVIINTDKTIKVVVEPNNFLIINNQQYELQEYHFHTPSEYTINGISYPLELHLVHQSKEGKIAVVGVLIKQGKYNQAIESLWKYLPINIEQTQTVKDLDNPKNFLPSDHKYYLFMGSLTTPPCSEDVQWHIIKKPLEMSSQQIRTFQKMFHNNARPLQPSNGRVVILDTKD